MKYTNTSLKSLIKHLREAEEKAEEGGEEANPFAASEEGVKIRVEKIVVVTAEVKVEKIKVEKIKVVKKVKIQKEVNNQQGYL